MLIAYQYMDVKKYKKALENLEKVLGRKVWNLDLLVLFSLILEIQSKIYDILEIPQVATTVEFIAECFSELGENQKALAQYERLLGKYSNE